MYKNVGKELKGWAKFLVILLTIPYVIIGVISIAYFSSEDQGGLGVLVAIMIVIVGYFLARMGAILLYAFGEIVDRVSSIENRVCGNVETHSTKKKEAKQNNIKSVEKNVELPAVERNSDGTWKCVFCGHNNLSGAAWCEECGIQANFE